MSAIINAVFFFVFYQPSHFIPLLRCPNVLYPLNYLSLNIYVAFKTSCKNFFVDFISFLVLSCHHMVVVDSKMRFQFNLLALLLYFWFFLDVCDFCIPYDILCQTLNWLLFFSLIMGKLHAISFWLWKIWLLFPNASFRRWFFNAIYHTILTHKLNWK